MINPDGTHETQITFPASDELDTNQNWWPDGAQIVYEHDTPTVSELWVVGADGSNPHEDFPCLQSIGCFGQWPSHVLDGGGNDAWIGGIIRSSNDPTIVGLGAWWDVTDNGEASGAPADITTFLGIGSLVQTQAFCDNHPAYRFPFAIDGGNIQVRPSRFTRAREYHTSARQPGLGCGLAVFPGDGEGAAVG